MKQIAVFVILFLGLYQSKAQTKLLTIEEAISKQKTTLAPEKVKQLQWVKDEEQFSFIDNINGKEYLIIQKATNKTPSRQISLDELNEAMVKANLKTFNTFPLINWENKNAFTFKSDKSLVKYEINRNRIVVLFTSTVSEAAENADIAEATNYTAYTIKNNLYVNDGENELIVTNDADENIVNGRSVHREEFGINKGTFWSPKGNLLAFYRMDQRMVTDYPIIDWTIRPAKNKYIKYPMAGDKSHEVTVGVYNVSNGKTIFLQTGEPRDQYLTNICWSPDEQHVYIAVLNREQNDLKLNSYDVVTGYFEKTILEEKNDKYVHPMHAMLFLPRK
ncbi:MAG TPA: DPP IV N-terminal domain-containing protein, partial [Chitinophagales bacterium]|nr:DPP IV N-terminal domain-containing protein [Chitinophagales bacterium]